MSEQQKRGRDGESERRRKQRGEEWDREERGRERRDGASEGRRE